MWSYNENHLSTGHSCWVSNPLDMAVTKKTTIEGRKAGTNNATHPSHRCSKTTHIRATRVVVGGSSKVSCEGFPMARAGDAIACGDTCGGTHSHKVSIG